MYIFYSVAKVSESNFLEVIERVIIFLVSFWSAFSSGLSFGWYDKWDVRQAEGRRMRRAMEQENSRERKSKKKDYNDKVMGRHRESKEATIYSSNTGSAFTMVK